MEKSIAISIIVPIYNSEHYLHDCLESIKNQTFEDFEVLLIDDGSSDHSGEVAAKFCEEDKRFIYLHYDRGGVANARNHGLEMSKGKYIGFVDSDDTVEKDYLYELYTAAENNGSEISSCSYSIVRTKKNKPDKPCITQAFIIMPGRICGYFTVLHHHTKRYSKNTTSSVTGAMKKGVSGALNISFFGL